MGAPLLRPRPLYQPRNPQASGLWRVTSGHFDEFERVYEERFAPKYGFWRPEGLGTVIILGFVAGDFL